MRRKPKPFVFDPDIIDDTPPFEFTKDGDIIYNEDYYEPAEINDKKENSK